MTRLFLCFLDGCFGLHSAHATTDCHIFGIYDIATAMRHASIEAYNMAQRDNERFICESLMRIIDHNLAEADRKIWHAHPVWFLSGNPIVGYGKLKDCIRLMFWSGQSFTSQGLTKTGTFKAAELRFTSPADIDETALQNWLKESKVVQWDYANIQKRKGRLERLV